MDKKTISGRAFLIVVEDQALDRSLLFGRTVHVFPAEATVEVEPVVAGERVVAIDVTSNVGVGWDGWVAIGSNIEDDLEAAIAALPMARGKSLTEQAATR